MVESPMVRPDELESLTRRYARYSRSAGGLASVIGGVFCLLSWLLGGLLPLTPPLRSVLIAMPFVWLFAKSGLMHRYYQRFGHAEEQATAVERLTHRFCVGFSLLVAVLVDGMVLIGLHDSGKTLTMGVAGYLILVACIPLAAWRWMRSPLDFIIGVFLFCQAGLVCVARAYPLLGMAHTHQGMLMSIVAFMFPLAALALIVAGVRDHRQFRDLRARLERWRDSQRGSA